MKTALLSIALLLASCGGGGGGEAVSESSVVVNESPVRYWQTYRGSAAGVHQWIESDEMFSVERLPEVGPGFRSGYAYIADGNLVMRNIATLEEFVWRDGAFVGRQFNASAPTFKTETHTFQWSQAASAVLACSAQSCERVEIQAGSFVYAYARKDDAVLAATNLGEVLLFRGGTWCRMSRQGETYRCAASAMVTAPTGVQFYSSIEYRGKVLVGEWPTGRLYEFNGSELFPSTMTPPKFASGDPIGYEAQAIAEYCGDLFVGYWPDGEIYRFDHKTGEWSFFQRLFTATGGEPFIPYSNRPLDGLDRSFYGQRVTALVPYGDSLYAVTSNLREWTPDVQSALTSAQQAEYGAVYRIKRPGCQTKYH